MGLYLFSRCSNSNCAPVTPIQAAPVVARKKKVFVTGNPNPANFQIIKDKKVGRFAVVWVNYPDSKNYEGNKILVFENISLKKIREMKSIDPHFCDEGAHTSPVARFIPTSKGWDYAASFCENA